MNKTVKEIGIGLDIGSTATKAVRVADGEIAESYVRATGSDMLAAGRDALDAVGGGDYPVIVTGYGRWRARELGEVVTEVACHARGAVHYFPDIVGLLDIGGQDAKAVRIRGGLPEDFALNDRCAAGTGRFLEFIAGRLEMDAAEMGAMELPGDDIPHLSSTCTVFAESEVISLLAEGISRPAIVAALFASVAKRMAGLVAQVHLDGKIALTGGGARYDNLVAAIRTETSLDVVVPPDPYLAGAFGAALVAKGL
ncbi:MAG: 2-hydroxyglutaryl-CoA dehydratase [bacterium]|nr:2-hydroxyglutaryl-CoA dehydratase [bacterium]